MTKDEALRLALEALEADELAMIQDKDGHMVYLKDQAINAIKAALANEALDKMAENARELGLDYYVPCCTDKTCPKCKAVLEAKDEPYAFEASMYSNDRMKVDPVTGNVSIGTPRRTWVGLTDEDKDFIVKRASIYDWHDYEVIEATEAKLKDKNESKN